MVKIHAPETAELLRQGLTQQEAHALEKDLTKVARAYGRAQAKVRRLKAALRKAEDEVRAHRRELRMLVSVRRVP